MSSSDVARAIQWPGFSRGRGHCGRLAILVVCEDLSLSPRALYAMLSERGVAVAQRGSVWYVRHPDLGPDSTDLPPRCGAPDDLRNLKPPRPQLRMRIIEKLRTLYENHRGTWTDDGRAWRVDGVVLLTIANSLQTFKTQLRNYGFRICRDPTAPSMHILQHHLLRRDQCVWERITRRPTAPQIRVVAPAAAAESATDTTPAAPAIVPKVES